MSEVVLTEQRAWPEAMGSRLAYAPDGRAWACASRSELQLFEDDELVASAPAPGDVLGELTFSADGTRVLVAPLAYDRAARAWLARPPAAEALRAGLEPLAAEGFAPVAGAWSPDGTALAVYGEYRAPRGIRARPAAGGVTARLVLIDGERSSVVWEGERSDPRGAIVVGDAIVASGGRALDVRERSTGRPLAVLEGFSTVARVLRLAPGGGRLAAGAADGTVAVWDTDSWEQVASWPAHPDEAAALAWHPDGATLATGGGDGQVRLWSAEGEALGGVELPEPITGLAFHPSGERLLAAPADLDGGVVALEPREA
jgi:WD40 repeat protein